MERNDSGRKSFRPELIVSHFRDDNINATASKLFEGAVKGAE